jgi:hypothetical protein
MKALDEGNARWKRRDEELKAAAVKTESESPTSE